MKLQCSSEWKKLRHWEPLEDFVGCSFDDSRKRLFYERNQLLAEEFEVLVDGLVDDVGNRFVALEKWSKVDASLFDEHLDVDFIHDEVGDAVDFLRAPSDSNFAATPREVSSEQSRSFYGQYENFSVHHVLSFDKQVWQIYFERVLRGKLDHAAKWETASYHNWV